jgi:alanyl-tRNA synthetase
MNSKQIKDCEVICKDIVDKKISVFASESSLAAAKDIQGLRAIFDEVRGSYHVVRIIPH